MTDRPEKGDDEPLAQLAARVGPSVLAVTVGTEGPSYRPVGARMAIWPDRSRSGTLSSGCVEADIATQALEALDEGRPRQVRYGRGSRFRDIQLPCGGALDILLLPDPDRDVLARVAARREARQDCFLAIDAESGRLELLDDADHAAGRFVLHLRPALRFSVFGKGPEAATFTSLAVSAGYEVTLFSPDGETLDAGRSAGAGTVHLQGPDLVGDIEADARTAVVLFFHDHEWEPPILAATLKTPAFYIGAQGSLRAREARMLMLETLGVSEADRARLHGPIGLIPSARDARTLAVSVLAEILAIAGPD